MRDCARCGMPHNLHLLRESVRQRVIPPVCASYVKPAPWWLRAATWLLGRRSHD